MAFKQTTSSFTLPLHINETEQIAPFLALPFEVRNQVYALLLDSNPPKENSSTHLTPPNGYSSHDTSPNKPTHHDDPQQNQALIPKALLLNNPVLFWIIRQIRKEVLALLYRDVSICITISPPQLCPLLSPLLPLLQEPGPELQVEEMTLHSHLDVQESPTPLDFCVVVEDSMLFIPSNQHSWIPTLGEDDIGEIQKVIRGKLGIREMQWVCERICEVFLQAWYKYDDAWPALPESREQIVCKEEWEEEWELVSSDDVAWLDW